MMSCSGQIVFMKGSTGTRFVFAAIVIQRSGKGKERERTMHEK